MNNQLRPEIKAYLDLSRGSNNYRLSVDDVAASLAANYRSTMEKYHIEIVVIWSNIAKNELVTCNNGIKTIIWDTNYWIHFAYYCNNLQSLEQHIKHDSPYSELHCDALWRDLFRIAFFRVNKNSLKYQLQFTKYYLSYGMRSFPFRDPAKKAVQLAYENMVNIANAKMYAFLHEIAHITAEAGMEYYIARLKDLFAPEFRDRTYSSVTEDDPYLEESEKDLLAARLDEMYEELNAGNLKSFTEIIADMRALHSICTSYISIVPDCSPEEFLQFKDGIILQRSFNLRIRNIEASLRALSSTPYLTTIRENIMNSQFGKEFYIRDKLSEVTEIFILIDSFRGIAGEAAIDFLGKYGAKPVYSRETAEAINQAISKHLEKVYDRIANEDISFSMSLNDASEIMDYLLYYPSQEQDLLAINQPNRIYGWTGLYFDDFINNRQTNAP